LFKLISVAILALAVLFVVFFFRCKHAASLAGVNPFAEDPYDAVGSIGIQLTMFTALLCLLRVFRPYATGEPPAGQRSLIVQGWAVSVMSVSMTLVTDVMGSPALQVPLGWLNPRKHRWNFAIPRALALGILLALSQAIGEGIAPGGGRFVLVVTIFISAEVLAVLLGYGLLARYLWGFS
jgi:hypothetical protein